MIEIIFKGKSDEEIINLYGSKKEKVSYLSNKKKVKKDMKCC